MARKLAPLSLHTHDDALRWYKEQMGEEATERQVRLAKIEQKKCVCEVKKIKKRWNGDMAPVSERAIHEKGCPKWRGWMSDI